MAFAKHVRHPSHTLLIHRKIDLYAIPNLLLDPQLSSAEQPNLIPLGAGALLPRNGAEVAELSAAPASDVVTALVQLDDRLAPRAGLPMLSPGQLAHHHDRRVLRAVFAGVRGLPTRGAHGRVAFPATDVILRMLCRA